VVELSSAEPTDGKGAPVLVARDVHVRYRVYDEQARSLRRLVARRFRPASHREVHAVRGVDLTLRRGEALGVIGRNGSGKSSLLRTLAGLVPPADGVVLAHSVPVLLGVSSVLQDELSCRRNVLLGATALGLDRSQAQLRMDDVLRFAGLEDSADLPFRTLSSGMRARLQFAVATAVVPEILMVDETLAVGDAEFRARSEQKMRELIEGAGAVVLVSHSMNLMMSVCTRLVWLDHGRIVADGDPREVVKEYESGVKR
jgi:teichoic acid transport system ATP-binding protein